MSNVTCLNEPSSIKSTVNVGILLNATYACTNTHTHAVQHNDQQTKCAIFFFFSLYACLWNTKLYKDSSLIFS